METRGTIGKLVRARENTRPGEWVTPTGAARLCAQGRGPSAVLQLSDDSTVAPSHGRPKVARRHGLTERLPGSGPRGLRPTARRKPDASAARMSTNAVGAAHASQHVVATPGGPSTNGRSSSLNALPNENAAFRARS